jgi:DNA-binding IclR family transcriptional regulator
MKSHEGRLSTSLVRGLLVLLCLPADGAEVTVTGVAKTLGLSPSTTYRYVSTLVELGLAERDPTSRKYRRVTT